MNENLQVDVEFSGNYLSEDKQANKRTINEPCRGFQEVI